MTSADVVIIGAGFAGVATAWWLAKMGVTSVIVIEREEQPGLHASSQNASIARQYEESPELHQLALEGVDFIRQPPAEWDCPPLLQEVGTLLLNPVETDVPAPSRCIDRREAIQIHPLLRDAHFDRAIWTATDGIVDVHAYLWAFINDAKKMGVTLECDQMVIGATSKNNGIHEVITDQKRYRCDCVINASGAWASMTAQIIQATSLKLRPLRRHLFTTPPLDWVDKKWPVIWDLQNHYYFRPESGGLLLSCCDESEVIPSFPKVDPKIIELLAEKIDCFIPALKEITIAHEWAGLRTFTDDREPVIGWDPALDGFFWVAGLGGRGVSTAASVGKMAAEAIIHRTQTPFSPR